MRHKEPCRFKSNPGHMWAGVRCRLLYIVGQLRLGGLERQLYYLLANLDRARYQPAVVVWNLNLSEKYYRDIEALNIPISGFPAEWSPLYKLHAVRTLARQLSPEVIHSYGFHTNFAAHYAARGIGALAIGSFRSDFSWAKREGGLIRGALNAHWPYFIFQTAARLLGYEWSWRYFRAETGLRGSQWSRSRSVLFFQ